MAVLRLRGSRLCSLLKVKVQSIRGFYLRVQSSGMEWGRWRLNLFVLGLRVRAGASDEPWSNLL